MQRFSSYTKYSLPLSLTIAGIGHAESRAKTARVLALEIYQPDSQLLGHVKPPADES